jgi:hypothetical protein
MFLHGGLDPENSICGTYFVAKGGVLDRRM